MMKTYKSKKKSKSKTKRTSTKRRHESHRKRHSFDDSADQKEMERHIESAACDSDAMLSDASQTSRHSKSVVSKLHSSRSKKQTRKQASSNKKETNQSKSAVKRTVSGRTCDHYFQLMPRVFVRPLKGEGTKRWEIKNNAGRQVGFASVSNMWAAFFAEYKAVGFLVFVDELDWDLESTFARDWTRAYEYTKEQTATVVTVLREFKRKTKKLLSKKVYETEVSAFENRRSDSDCVRSYWARALKKARKQKATVASASPLAAMSDSDDDGVDDSFRSKQSTNTRANSMSSSSTSLNVSATAASLAAVNEQSIDDSVMADTAREGAQLGRDRVIHSSKQSAKPRAKARHSSADVNSDSFADSDVRSPAVDSSNKLDNSITSGLEFEQQMIADLQETGAMMLIETGTLKTSLEETNAENRALRAELRKLRGADIILENAQLKKRTQTLDNGWRACRKRLNRVKCDLSWFQQTLGFKKPIKEGKKFSKLKKTQRFHYLAGLRNIVALVPGGLEFQRQVVRVMFEKDAEVREWCEKRVTDKMSALIRKFGKSKEFVETWMVGLAITGNSYADLRLFGEMTAWVTVQVNDPNADSDDECSSSDEDESHFSETPKKKRRSRKRQRKKVDGTNLPTLRAPTADDLAIVKKNWFLERPWLAYEEISPLTLMRADMSGFFQAMVKSRIESRFLRPYTSCLRTGVSKMSCISG